MIRLVAPPFKVLLQVLIDLGSIFRQVGALAKQTILGCGSFLRAVQGGPCLEATWTLKVAPAPGGPWKPLHGAPCKKVCRISETGGLWRLLEACGGLWRPLEVPWRPGSPCSPWPLEALGGPEPVCGVCFEVVRNLEPLTPPVWLSGLLVLKFARRRGPGPRGPLRIHPGKNQPRTFRALITRFRVMTL